MNERTNNACSASAKAHQRRATESSLDDIFIPQLLQQANLANSSTGHSFVLSLQSDLLESNDPPSVDIPSLVHDAVSA